MVQGGSPPKRSGLDELAARIDRTQGLVLVVTGAGVSVASGLATFRGTEPNAVWANDVMEMGTRRFFERDPIASWRWYLSRFDSMRNARSNAGHEALVSMERQLGGRYLLVTQNIDGLHRMAGSKNPIKVHGRFDMVRCSELLGPGEFSSNCSNAAPDGTLPFSHQDQVAFANKLACGEHPACPECGGALRPHVLWFDEMYAGHRSYRAAEVWAAAERAEMVLFVGTSLSVGVTSNIVTSARERGAFVATIDPGKPDLDRTVLHIEEPAEVALPHLASLISGA